MRFLLSRRWGLFLLAVVVLAYAAVLLGQWQFNRLHERKHTNRVTATNLVAPPVPLGTVLSTARAPRAADEWRTVTAHGTWDDAHTIVLKYQTRDSGPGVDLVTPLVTASGDAVLVDRGWMATANEGATRPKLPPVTSGQVTVTGYVRLDATGSATHVADLATRAVSSRTAEEAVGRTLYQGFLDVKSETPAPAHRLAGTELPDDTSNGPHFFYGLQWWFFAALAVFGFCYLAWDELRRRRTATRAAARTRSQRPQHAAVHGQHRPADEG